MGSSSSKKAVPAASAKTSTPSAAPSGSANASRGNAAAQEAVKSKGAGLPYSDKYGGKRTDAFQVDAGQLTFDAEGMEGGRFHSRTAHVPPGPSGVTIGRGYDLGQHTAAQINDALTAVGLSKSAAAAYAKSAGLKGDEARSWLKKHKSSLAEISPAQQESLFSTTYGEMSAGVGRISKKPDVAKKYGAADLDEMTPAIRDTLVDLRYRGDYTGKAREKIRKKAADNDLIGTTDSLTDRKQWPSVPEDRFQRRAAYLQEAEVKAETAAYATGFGPMEPGMPTLSQLQAEEAAKTSSSAGGTKK